MFQRVEVMQSFGEESHKQMNIFKRKLFRLELDGRGKSWEETMSSEELEKEIHSEVRKYSMRW